MNDIIKKAIKALTNKTPEEMKASLYNNAEKSKYVFVENKSPVFLYAEKDKKKIKFSIVCAIYNRKVDFVSHGARWLREIGVVCSGVISPNGNLTFQVNDGFSKSVTRLVPERASIMESYERVERYVFSRIIPTSVEEEEGTNHLHRVTKSHGMFNAFVDYVADLAYGSDSEIPQFAGVNVNMMGFDFLMREYAHQVSIKYADLVNRKTMTAKELLHGMESYPALPEEKVKQEINPGRYALRKSVTYANVNEHHIYCSCGEKSIVSLINEPKDVKELKGEDYERYRKSLAEAEQAFLCCPVCGRRSKWNGRNLVEIGDSPEKPVGSVFFKIFSEETALAFILYAEKATRLPGDTAVLIRCYRFEATALQDSIRTTVKEEIRCFLVENQVYFFVNRENNWILCAEEEASIVLNVMKSQFSMQDNLEKILKGTLLDRCGFISALKKGFPDYDSQNCAIQIRGGLQSVLTVMKYPGVADLYQKGFRRIAHLLSIGQKKLLKPGVLSAEEMFSTTEEVLQEIGKLDSQESLDAEDLKEIIKVSKNKLEDVPIAYWAAANCVIKEVAFIARACKISFVEAAQRVSEIAELELEPVSQVVKNLVEHIRRMKYCAIQPELPAAGRYDRDGRFVSILHHLCVHVNFANTQIEDFSVDNAEEHHIDAVALYENRSKRFVQEAMVFATGIIDRTKSPAVLYVAKRVPVLRNFIVELVCKKDGHELQSISVKIQDSEIKSEKLFHA